MVFDRPQSEHELLSVIKEYVRSLLYHTLQPSVLLSDYALSAAINSFDLYDEEISTIHIGEAMAYGRFLHLDYQTYRYPFFLVKYPIPVISYHKVTAYPYRFCWEELFCFQDMERKGLCNIATTLKHHKLL